MFKRAYRFVLGDYLLRNSAVMALGAISTGALNYLFQVAAARTLSVAEYGVLGAFFALFYVVTYSGQAISLFTTKNVALAKSEPERSYVLRHSLLLFGGGAAALFVIYALLTPLIQRGLHVDSVTIVILAGLVMLALVVHQMLLGYARGVEDFLHPNLSNILSALLKLVIGIGLVLLGAGITGAFAGLLIGSVLGVLYLLFLYRRPAFAKQERQRMLISKREFLMYFAILFFSILFIDIDVLLVKYFFTEYDAGLYAAVSLLGKIVLFVAGAAVPVVFPRIVKHIEDGRLHKAMGYFWKSFAITGLSGGAVLLVYALAPGLVVQLLYGSKYPIAHLVLLAGLQVLLYSLLSVVALLALALRQYWALICLGAGVLAQTALIVWRHESLYLVLLWSTLAIFATMVLIGTGLVVVVRRAAKQPVREKQDG